MSARRGWSVARTRRWVQVSALLLFFGLFIAVRASPGWEPSWAHRLFLLLDPLLLVATVLAAHAVPVILWLALGTVLMTVLLGRVFCGWICPFGTLHALAGRVLFWLLPARKAPQSFSSWQRAKYYVLAGFLVMAAFGGHWVCVLDPIVLLTRSCAVALFPGAQWAAEEGSTAVYMDDSVVGAFLVKLSEPPYRLLRDHVLGVPRLAFWGGGPILALFAGTLLLNRVRRRFWCRYVCPLGALLGLAAWRPVLRRKVVSASCNGCDLCGMSCPGAASAGAVDRWWPSECLVCHDCAEACARSALGFTVASPAAPEPRIETLDLSKRALVGSAVGGLLGLGLMRITPQARGSVYHPDLIRPPGSRSEREFLQRCLACGLCLKVCPTGGLQPTMWEAGLEGIWTPRLVPQIGCCDYTCNLCGLVCPTEAIRPLPLDLKQKTRIGLAAFDTSRCIPYAYGRDCMVCEEHCPIPDKAIYVVEVDVIDREGKAKRVKQPRVDADKCIGCGICENVCPYRDAPAIRVRSANESRHSAEAGARPPNEPILPEEKGGVPY